MFNFLKKKTQEDTEKQPAPQQGWLSRLRDGLSRSRQNFTDSLSNLILGKKEIDQELLQELETKMLTADVGVDTTSRILETLALQMARHELANPQALIDSLKQQLQQILIPYASPLTINDKPFVILMVGVNGAGKTTSIAKIAHYYQQQQKKVMLAAGDTFRAAAVEQLQVWGQRNNVPVIAQHTGADSASVAFDALKAAQSRNIDLLITDTAGRLHTQGHLMSELEKIKRVISKQNPAAPHEVMLVLDASMGQNALQQAKQFHQCIGVTGITITKLDGTAKGGILFAIADSMRLPIRFIGIGEKMDDLRPFDAQQFVEALFAQEQSKEATDD